MLQRWFEVPRGRPDLSYLLIVRGETRMPSFRSSSFAICSSPQMGFLLAIFRIRLLRFLGRGGRPILRDFQRQNKRNASRCQRVKVAA